MLTTTAIFDKFRKQPNAIASILVHIIGKSPTTHFRWSDRRVDLILDGDIYLPLIKEWGTISHKIDLFTKKSNIANAKITLRNTPYKRDTNGDVCISDELFVPDIINQSIKIYIWFEGITQLSDCLQVYDGYVQPPTATPEIVIIPFTDASLKFNKDLPLTILAEGADDTTDLPRISYGQPLSLGYGIFSMPEGHTGNAIEGRWTAHNKLVFTDHVMNSLDEVWLIDPSLGIPVRLDEGNYTVTLDDNGQTTIIVDDDFVAFFAEALIYPSIASRDFAGIDLWDGFSNLNNSFDQNPDTFMAGIVGDSSAKSNGTYIGYVDNGLQEAGPMQSVILEVQYKTVDPLLGTGLNRFSYVADGSATGPTIDIDESGGKATSGGPSTLTDTGQSWATNEWAGFSVEIMFGVGQGQVEIVVSNTATELTITGIWSTNPDPSSEYTLFGLPRSVDYTSYAATNMPTWQEIAQRADGSQNFFWGQYGGDIQGSDRDYIQVDFIRFKIAYRSPVVIPRFRIPLSNFRIFCTGIGREFGSWIDGGGRSNSFDEGDAITNPAFIIESLCRDELGLTTSLINEASFDSVANDLSSWTAAISINKVKNSFDIITDLCKQFKINFFYDPSGKAKVITIDNSPSKDDDLLFRDIIAKSFTLSKGNMKNLVNQMRIQYFQNFFDEQTTRYTEAGDSTSQTQHNIINIFELKAPYITTTAVALLLREHYRNTFWKDLHETAFVKLLTWEHIDWEVGDIIEPDSGLNAFLKKFNADWGSATFSPYLMVIHKIIRKLGIEMKLMQVGDSGA